MKPKVFICIPVHNRVRYTVKCLESIFAQTYNNFHIIISDAGSTDGTSEEIETRFPQRVTVISVESTHWWTGGMNACIRYALNVSDEKDYIFTLNNDTELAPDCLEHLISFALCDSKSIVGALNLFYADRTRIEPSAFYNKSFLGFYYTKRLFSFGQVVSLNMQDSYHVDTLSGKGVLLPISVFRRVGLYNQVVLPHYHADTEFIHRSIKNGYHAVILRKAVLFSHVNETGYGTLDKSLTKFIKGFWSKKSALYIKSTFFYSKLVYGHRWSLYFFPFYAFVMIGYVKRLFAKNNNKIKP